MTKRQAKARAYRWAAEVLDNALSAGAILSEDPAEDEKLVAALEEVIAGLYQRHRSLDLLSNRWRDEHRKEV